MLQNILNVRQSMTCFIKQVRLQISLLQPVAMVSYGFFLSTFWISPIEAGADLQVRMACGPRGSSQLLHAEVLCGLWKIFDTWMTWHDLHKNCAALCFGKFLVDLSLCKAFNDCSVCHRMPGAISGQYLCGIRHNMNPWYHHHINTATATLLSGPTLNGLHLPRICYRMEPASKQDEMYCLLGDYSVPGMVIAMAAILLCFLVALIWWKKKMSCDHFYGNS